MKFSVVTVRQIRILWPLFLLLVGSPVYGFGDYFPKLMGMNIGVKNYDDPSYQKDIARLSWVILGFYPGWQGENAKQPMASAVSNLKRLNSSIVVGQYTNVMEAYDDKPNFQPHNDKARKLSAEGWWLQSGSRSKVAWTDRFGTFLTNFSSLAPLDRDGKSYAEWLASRDANRFFGQTSGFGIWYFDNVDAKPKIRWADWDGDGRDDDGLSEGIARAYREGFKAHWRAARSLRPDMLLVGNVTTHDLSAAEFRGELNGVFLEALAGEGWSLIHRGGWKAVMTRYFSVRDNLAEPKLVGFNVVGEKDDYQFARFMFASCLLGDGYFSYTDRKVGYSSVPWFDEFDVRLGKAIDAPSLSIWKAGVYRRRFEGGLVLVNPQKNAVRVDIGPGYRRVRGKQDVSVNDGSSALSVNLPAESGLVLVKE